MKVIALDAGQTGIRARVIIDEHIVNEIECPGILTDRAVVPQLAEATAKIQPPTGCVLAVGSSGLGEGVTATELLRQTNYLGIDKVLLAHDSITSYLGAIGDIPGAVVACGTGVVTLAVGQDCLTRVDGWGYLVGDAGSGYWIGRAGIDAVLRAYDGRGPATALSDRVLPDFSCPEHIYLELQADTYRVSRIASYARIVSELAGSDEVCAQICEQAASELATSVLAGLTRVGEAEREDPAVSMVGKVFHGRVLAEEFSRLLSIRFPEVRIIPPEGTGLDGAARLASLATSSPLWDRVTTTD